ncbi:MAG: hypothetical protein AB1757_11465 [Acidobacteriota bacterium]
MMRRSILIGLVWLMLTGLAWAGPKPDYNGKWKLDFAKCEGVPQGMDQVMTITHKGDDMTVVTKVYPAQDMLASVVNDSYALGGQETKYVAQYGGEPGEGKRLAKWSNDGWGLDISEEAAINTKQGVVKLVTSRKWMLSPDGKTITIEMTAKNPRGETKTKRVFVKV